MVWPVKPDAIREMTDEELHRKVNELKEELFNLRFQLATGQLDNPMRVKAVRRDLARVKTISRERQLNIKR